MPLGWWLYRRGLSGNAVSLINLALAVPACLLLASTDVRVAIAGAALLNLVALLDCVDGNIARASRMTGPHGDWIDAVVGYAVYTLMPLALGFRVGLLEPGPSGVLAMLLGGMAASFNLYSRLAFQKHENGLLHKGPAGGGVSELSSRSSLTKRISADAGLSGVMMPALALALLLSLETVFLGFYALLYGAVAICVIASRIGKLP